MEPLPSDHEDQVREIVKQQIDQALEALADSVVYELEKHHNLTGRAAARAVTDGVFMARRKIGQS
jgi:hypothetical protein